MIGPEENTSYIGRIDPGTRSELVRNVLHDQSANPISWSVQPMAAGASTSGIYRVAGQARSGGATVPWKFVLKMINHAGQGWQEGSTDPTAWNYWKREWLVYRAPWIHDLHGVVAPECFGSGQIDEVAVWVAVEDLSQYDQRPWSRRQFAACARHLGEFNGQLLTTNAPPQDPWLSRHWVRGWTEQTGSVITSLPSFRDNPAVSEAFPTSTVEQLLRVWDHRSDFYRALDMLQHSLAHNDVYPRNAFIETRDPQQTIAIDWAFSGAAPLGADLAPLLGISLSFFEADCEDADDLERLCLASYLEGLRRAGSDISPDDVFVGYLATIVLRLVGASGTVLGLLLDDSLEAVFEHIFGQPRPALLDRWRKLNAFTEPRMAKLLRLFGYR